MLQRIAILAPLRHRPFRVLFAGQLVSDLGDWLDFLALVALIVYRWDLGPTALAALAIAEVLPMIAVAPIAGVWVDRLPRKQLMIGADLARALIVLGLVFAPELISLLALVFLKMTFSAVFGPARQATISETVPEVDLLPANGLSQLSVQGTKILGPVLGGVIVSLWGPRAAFAVDAVTFLVSAAFLTQLPALLAQGADDDEEDEQPTSFWTELRAGLDFILHTRTLAVSVIGMSAALFMIFTFDDLGPLALRELGVGEALLGLAVGSVGLGTAVGAIVVSQWGSRVQPFLIMGGGKVVAGLAMSAVGVAAILHANATGLAWIPVWLLIGLSGAAIFVPYGFILQRVTPPELMGRVFASANGIQTAFQLSAPVIGAAIAEYFGIGFVLAIFGIGLTLVGVVVMLLRPPVPRESDDDSDAVEQPVQTTAA
ncbi:MAG TPA: MFS transporter [Chloroflexota bacterium]|nr:MFS transporter [Chloroflexota bacterium]